jgi:phosphoribosylformylglycinamidine cyclo-ligase
MESKPLTYKDSGVNIDSGTSLVERIKPIAKATRRPEVLSNLGGFNALFELPIDRYKQPILVSSTDGVGTKLRLALSTQNHSGIGVDLVAMCVNDLIVCGAEPLFFLDYYASGKLDLETATSVIASIGEGCKSANTALIGGETAEMPGIYQENDYDLAGFCVGVVEKELIIDCGEIHDKDVIIGIASSGPHSNGYSLIRKILAIKNVSQEQKLDGQRIIDLLLAPTRIYVKSILSLIKQVHVHGMAHITGGGLLENIPRILPHHLKAVLQTKCWPQQAIFDWLQTMGNIEQQEMWRTFNCGIGFIIVVPEAMCDNSIDILHACQEKAWVIGHIQQREKGDSQIIIQ